MLRLIFCLSLFCGSFAMASTAKRVSKRGVRASTKTVKSGGALQHFAIKMRYSAKSWTTPEEVIPPEFYDIPGEERSPNSNTEKELSIDDLFGANKDLPDYGEDFEGDKAPLEESLDY